MFWLNQALTIILALLGIGLVRGLICSWWPSIHERHLDIVLCAVFILAFTIGLVSQNKDASHISELQSSNQQLTTEVDEGKKRIALLEDRARPRQLSESQVKGISDLLQSVPPSKVRMIYNTGEEVARFVSQLTQVFQTAGWTIEYKRISVLNTLEFGLTVYAVESPPNESTSVLYRELQNANLGIKFFQDITLPPDVIGLEIGAKGP